MGIFGFTWAEGGAFVGGALGAAFFGPPGAMLGSAVGSFAGGVWGDDKGGGAAAEEALVAGIGAAGGAWATGLATPPMAAVPAVPAGSWGALVLGGRARAAVGAEAELDPIASARHSTETEPHGALVDALHGPGSTTGVFGGPNSRDRAGPTSTVCGLRDGPRATRGRPGSSGGRGSAAPPHREDREGRGVRTVGG